MNFNSIKNIGEPGHISDAATKGYVDNSINDVVDKAIKQRTHLITAHASYHGDLIKGGYQFTFGGSSTQSYKKHNVFNGFLVPERGFISKFVALDTGIKINVSTNMDLLNYVVVNTGLNVPIPLFTLVLIRKNEKPVDIGTLHFMFTKYDEIGEEGESTVRREYEFKRSKLFDDDEKKGIFVNEKDILNIRTEFNSIPLSKYRLKTYDLNYELDNFDTEFYMYHATILIELDPL